MRVPEEKYGYELCLLANLCVYKSKKHYNPRYIYKSKKFYIYPGYWYMILGKIRILYNNIYAWMLFKGTIDV